MKATFRALLLAAVGAVALSASAVAQEGFVAPETDRVFSQGVAAYKRGDFATALRIWRPLAEQGDADAQSNLGLMYDNGEGVPENDAEAVRWYRLAADQGSAWAQFNLGINYEIGQGVPQNYVEAYRWFNLAASDSRALAAPLFARAVERRDRLLTLMTPAQIAEGQRLAADWRPRIQVGRQ